MPITRSFWPVVILLVLVAPVSQPIGSEPYECVAGDSSSNWQDADEVTRAAECINNSVGASPHDDYSDWYYVSVGPVPNRGGYDEVNVKVCAILLEDGDGTSNSEIPLKFRVYFRSVQPGYPNYPSDPNWDIYEVSQDECVIATDTMIANAATNGYWYLEVYRAVLDPTSARGKAQYEFTIT